MRLRVISINAIIAMVVLIALGSARPARAQSPAGTAGQNIHVLPPPGVKGALGAVTGPLLYNGGSIMTGARAYAIFLGRCAASSVSCCGRPRGD